MGSSNKDRKAKKKEADAKLRQHVESGANVKTLEQAMALDGGNKIVSAVADTAVAMKPPQPPATPSSSNSLFAAPITGGPTYNESDDEDGNVDDARINKLAGEDNDQQQQRQQQQGEGSGDNTNQQNQQQQQGSGQPKRKKFRQEELKLALTHSLGPKGLRFLPLVDPHAGNAPDPFTLLQLKGNRANVPVPYHWLKVSAYLSTQNDRPPANIITEDVKKSGVDPIRRGINPNPDVSKLAAAFLTGNPLQTKEHNVRLMEKGGIYKGKRWKPSFATTPGVISEQLRSALGMLSTTSPPPWIHSMQRARIMPPSYPNAKYPGLNKPIPDNGQWGYSRGQWGEPVRADDGSFLYPAVQSLGTAGQAAASALDTPYPTTFGLVPPRRRATDTAEEDDTLNGAQVPTIINADANKGASGGASKVIAARSFVANVRNTGVTLPPRPPIQMDQYLVDISAEEDDMLSAGARLVAKAGVGAAGGLPAGVAAVNLTANVGM